MYHPKPLPSHLPIHTLDIYPEVPNFQGQDGCDNTTLHNSRKQDILHHNLNTFSIDPKTVCVEAHETKYMDQLDKLGFEVVPVPFADVFPFGGGLHCATVDVYREGNCEDYFPNQIDGF